MTDLYDRLEELREVTHVLTRDVKQLRPLLGDRSIAAAVSPEEEANRRFYVRAIFALIEALVEQHKQLLLDLDESGKVSLNRDVRQALSERVSTFAENGTVSQREQYLRLQTKIRTICQTAGEAFGQRLHVSFGDQGWTLFREAVKTRDRITHPKSSQDCHVDEDNLKVVDQAHDWFRALYNEFIRVARAHREQHGW